MALLNLLSPNTYSVVDQLSYSKQDKHVSFLLKIYTNSDKSYLLTQLSVSLSGNSIVEEIESRTVTTPPKNPQPDQKWFVPEGATGAWAEHVGKVVLLDPQGNHEWTHMDIDGNTAWVKDEQKYVRFDTPQKVSEYRGKREFDLHFNWSKIESQGLLACCYDYAKTLNLGENIKDG